MTYDEVIQLVLNNRAPSDWIRVVNEVGDGSFTSLCKEDILLTIAVDVIWKAGKPVSSFQFRYGTTIFGWFEIPVLQSTDLETFAAGLSQIVSQLTKGT